MKQIKFTETVLRDAQQSLIATRMSFDDFEPVLAELDKAGFYSLECWGGATFDSCLRYLNEDPWERLRKIRKACPNTKLQMLLRGQNLLGYKHYPDDVEESSLKRALKTESISSESSTHSTTFVTLRLLLRKQSVAVLMLQVQSATH